MEQSEVFSKRTINNRIVLIKEANASTKASTIDISDVVASEANHALIIWMAGEDQPKKRGFSRTISADQRRHEPRRERCITVLKEIMVRPRVGKRQVFDNQPAGMDAG